MTFRGWLRSQRKRDDRVGDLARDVAADGKCWTGRSALSLLRHMRDEHDASYDAIRTHWIAYREWKRVR